MIADDGTIITVYDQIKNKNKTIIITIPSMENQKRGRMQKIRKAPTGIPPIKRLVVVIARRHRL